MGDSEERRAAQRSRSLLGAKIIFNRGGSVLDCVVRNISTSGAQIKLENSISPPETFELHVANGEKFQCTVVWRKTGAIGVHFLSAVT